MNHCGRERLGACLLPALKPFVPLLMVLPCIAVLAAGHNAPPQKNYATVAAVLEQFIQHEMNDKQLPAFSIALVDDQQIVWSKGFGYADPQRKTAATADTIYRIGSVSKLFTDIGIMQLVEQERIDLDAPVSTYVPEFQPRNQFDKPITLRQLMSHRAGLVREPPMGHYFDATEPSLADTVRSLNSEALVYPPETRVKYSNAGVAVVGYVLQVMGKKPFAAYLKEAALKPMGLEHSAFEPEPAIRRELAKAYLWTYDGKVFEAPKWQFGMSPAASMYSSVNDLGGFMSVIFAGGRGPHDQVIKPETPAAMWTPQFPNAGGPRSFGLGFVLSQLDGHRLVGHSGAVYGFATEIELLPDDKLGAVAVTTMDSANAVVTHVANEALRLMLAVKAGKPLPVIPVTHPIPVRQMNKLAGRYGEGENAFDLIPKGNDLYLSFVRGGYEMRLRQLGDALMTDDRLQYGLKLRAEVDGIRLENELYYRAEPPPAASVPEEWKELLGEYGWDYDILYIKERDGKLASLIEWYEFEPLEPVTKDIFRYPTRGLYDTKSRSIGY